MWVVIPYVKETPGVFRVEGKRYPVKPCIYNFIRKYLYSKENIEWVKCDEPNIKFGVSINKKTKTVCRRIRDFLNETDIGQKVVNEFNLKSI